VAGRAFQDVIEETLNEAAEQGLVSADEVQELFRTNKEFSALSNIEGDIEKAFAGEKGKFALERLRDRLTLTELAVGASSGAALGAPLGVSSEMAVAGPILAEILVSPELSAAVSRGAAAPSAASEAARRLATGLIGPVSGTVGGE
jgi:hypothetical protein